MTKHFAILRRPTVSDKTTNIERTRTEIQELERKLATSEAVYQQADEQSKQIAEELVALGFAGPDFESQINAAQDILTKKANVLSQNVAELEAAVERAYVTVRG
jgi:chromosome segregation ATPase